MQLPLLVLLTVLAAYFLYAQMVFVTYIIGFVIIADSLTGFVSNIFGASDTFVKGGAAAIKAEGEEMSKARPPLPEGKKFVADGFSRIGKALGEGEKARREGKKIEGKTGLFEVAGQMSEDLLEGIMKLVKK